MKHQYTTFTLAHFSKEQRKYISGLSERDYFSTFGTAWKRLCEKSTSAGLAWDRETTYIDAILYFMWKYRKITHYFLAPGVASFCTSSVKELTPDFCKRLPECEPVDPPENSLPMVVVVGDDMKMRGGFAIHFPTSERKHSIMVLPNSEIPHPGQKAIYRYFFAASDGIDTVLMQKENFDSFWDGVDRGAHGMARLVFGLSLYMDAFPDAVVEASGEDVKHIGYYSGQRRTVTPNEIVDEERRHGVSPHWRRGHFRVLASERFTRKQGQTVYVRGTFVKGKAFAVLDDAPPCKANPKNQTGGAK
jgi:hypothetical protein